MNTLNRRYLFDVRPRHRETLASYTTRLLAANFDTAAHQRQLTRAMNPSSKSADREAAWTEVLRVKTKRTTLHFAGSDTAWMSHPDDSSCATCSEGLPERTMCSHCAHGQTIRQHPHFDELVCARHKRWIGLSGGIADQHPASDQVVAAGRQFTKLRRQRRLDVRLFTMLSNTLHDDTAPADRNANAVNARTFPIVVALVALLTSAGFASRFFNPAVPFAESYRLLLDTVRGVLGRDSPRVARAIWLYARPTFWMIRDSIITGKPYAPVWSHDLFVPPAVIRAATCTETPLEPFANFLAITGDDQLSASRHGLKPDQDEAARINTETTGGVRKRIRTICADGHQFDRAPLSAADIKHGKVPTCPLCRHRMVVPGYNDLATTHPETAKEFDLSRNGGLVPANIAPSSLRQYFWRCHAGHSYQAAAGTRTHSKTKCPVCLGRVIIVGVNDLSTTHPHLVAEWHPAWLSYMTPTTITAGSNGFVTWLCPEGHTYQMRVWDRAHGAGCGSCSRSETRASADNLAITHPVLSLQWHPTSNGTTRPEDYTAGSKEVVYWLCTVGHRFYQRIERRASGYGCSVCSRRTLIPGVNDLATTEPELVKEWHPYLNLKHPHETFAGNDPVWWKCIANGHKYKQNVPNRVKSRGCPECEPEERIRR